MTATRLTAATIAVLALAACGATGKPAGSAGSSQALAWAGCLRSHGVPSFPDPIPGHKAMFPDSAGALLQSHSPAVLAAERACKQQNPAGAAAATGASTGQKRAMLGYARCMRAHGVPDYPDPTYGSNGRPIVPDFSSAGIDTQSPAFTTAAKQCQGHGIPG